MAVRLSRIGEDEPPKKSSRQRPLIFLLIVVFVSLHETLMMSSGTFQGWKRRLFAVEDEQQLPLTDTTVIITSSLIPTHPSIRMVNETVDSIREMLEGLAYNTPILISVDGRKEYNKEDTERLQGYVENLRIRFQHDPYVTILNNYQFGHISNSIRVALLMVETEFVYVVQHDFKFIKPINHSALTGLMTEIPEQIQIIRFNKGKRTKQDDPLAICSDYNQFTSVKYGTNLTLAHWSDNNHLTTKRYYQKILEQIGPTPRAVESPLMHCLVYNTSDCTYLRQYVYNWEDGPFIKHLDGRNTLE